MKTKLDFSPESLILAALAVLLVPLRWIAAFFLASLFHELLHILMLRACKVRILSISFGTHGILIRTAPLAPLQELLCAAAGPAGSLSLLFFRGLYPELALAGLVQGAFNLLPSYPSDGGRIAGAALELSKCGKKDSILKFLNVFIHITISFACLILAILFPRWIPLMTVGGIILTARQFRNISCKASPFEVQ